MRCGRREHPQHFGLNQSGTDVCFVNIKYHTFISINVHSSVYTQVFFFWLLFFDLTFFFFAEKGFSLLLHIRWVERLIFFFCCCWEVGEGGQGVRKLTGFKRSQVISIVYIYF